MSVPVIENLKVAWARASAKTPRQISRYIFTGVWPLSVAGRYFYALRYGQRWHRYTNRVARDAFSNSRLTLNSNESRLLSQLQNDGIAVDQNHQLFSKANIDELCHCLDPYLKNPRVTSQIKNRKSSDGSKWYIIRAFGRRPPPLPPAIQNIIFSNPLLNIVSSYLQAWPKLRYVDVWYNIAAHEHERPIDSEIWHRDNDDLNVLTLFLYLDDVSSENGPFSYIKKSQRGGKYDHIAPAVPPLGSYPSSEEIYPQIPVEQIIQCEGLRGTAILSDTSGLHLGGRVKSGSRLVLTARYVTNAGIDRYSYVCEPSSSNNSTPRERFLLS